MLVQINKTWRITSDPMNFILQKKNNSLDKAGNEVWSTVGYYNTFENLMFKTCEHVLKASTATSTTGLLESLKEINDIINQCKSIFPPMTKEVAVIKKGNKR